MSAAPGRGLLPFDLPPTSALHASPRKVFAHYVPALPVSLDNQPADSDYYTRNYLDPEGEHGIHAAYGGYLRDRPLPRAPLLGNWQLQDMQTEVRQAISVGIDGFVVDVLQLGDTGGALWRNTQTLLQAAASVDPNFAIVLMPDMTGSAGQASPEVLAQYVAQLGQSPSAYRVVSSGLVVSPFNTERHPVSWWSQFLSVMRSTYHTQVAFLPLFQDEQRWRDAYAPISYGMATWGSRHPQDNDPTATTPTAPLGRIQAVHDLHRVWMQPVSAQDERPREGLYDEADNTTNLRDTWQIAIRSHSEIVQLATWNDYAEGSQLAPSSSSGWSWLDINAYFLAWYKLGSQPTIVRNTIYLTHRVQPYRAPPTFPETKLMAPRGPGPSRDTVEALTFLTSPATVTVHAGSSTATCSAPIGVAVCTVPSHPGGVSATATATGTTLATVTSTHQVTTTPYHQDLHYYAASSGISE